MSSNNPTPVSVEMTPYRSHSRPSTEPLATPEGPPPLYSSRPPSEFQLPPPAYNSRRSSTLATLPPYRSVNVSSPARAQSAQPPADPRPEAEPRTRVNCERTDQLVRLNERLDWFRQWLVIVHIFVFLLFVFWAIDPFCSIGLCVFEKGDDPKGLILHILYGVLGGAYTLIMGLMCFCIGQRYLKQLMGNIQPVLDNPYEPLSEAKCLELKEKGEEFSWVLFCPCYLPCCLPCFCCSDKHTMRGISVEDQAARSVPRENATLRSRVV